MSSWRTLELRAPFQKGLGRTGKSLRRWNRQAHHTTNVASQVKLSHKILENCFRNVKFCKARKPPTGLIYVSHLVVAFTQAVIQPEDCSDGGTAHAVQVGPVSNPVGVQTPTQRRLKRASLCRKPTKSLHLRTTFRAIYRIPASVGANVVRHSKERTGSFDGLVRKVHELSCFTLENLMGGRGAILLA